MKHLKTTLAMTMMATAMMACQQDKGITNYTINGTAQGYAQGDTLLVTNDLMTGRPTDTIVIGSNGAFTLKGSADSVCMHAIYDPQNPQNLVQFFNEAGTLKVEMTKEPGMSNVSGSKANDALQDMINKITPYAERMRVLRDSFVNITQGTDESEIWALRERLNQIYTEQAKMVLATAEDNIDNELGFYLTTQYRSNDPEIDQQFTNLLDKLPEKFQKRPLVAQMRPKTEVEDFTMPRPDGSDLSIMSEIKKNKLTLIDFWASWCGPCRQEMPFMVGLYEKYQSKGLGIVGISLDNDRDAWIKAITDLGIKWAQMSDLQGWQSAAAKAYKVESIPHILIVDQQGKILARGLRGEKLEQFVSSQLGE